MFLASLRIIGRLSVRLLFSDGAGDFLGIQSDFGIGCFALRWSHGIRCVGSSHNIEYFY